MKSKQLVTLLTGAMLFTSFSAFAEDPAQVSQDKQALQQTKSEIKADRQKLAQDKASGDTAQVAKDKAALKDARRKKHEERRKLHVDKGVKGNESAPAPTSTAPAQQ